jgi:VCBS repeat-containing protein
LSLAGKFTDLTPDSLGAHPGAHVHVGTVSGHAPADAIIIPDAHLLFTGDFKRAGVDLVVSGDGHEVVLHDYFKGEKRAALASPDGAHLTGDIINALTGHTQFAQADGSASVAQVIGHVTKLTGTATAIRNGVSIILNQGDNVNKGDVVASGSDSTLGITFIDGTVFGLASNAKMVLNEMIYDPNGSDNKSLISLVQGTISFVAGATAKHGDMKVDTPVATMGIRGTAVLVEIDFTVPANGGAPPAKFQVLVEPDGTTGSYILFDKTTLTPIATVNQAGTQTIVNGQGGVNFLSSAQLSADAQKIITDVFALKFSDLNNPNTKTATNSTDTIIPFNTFIKLANGDSVPVQVLFGNLIDKPASVTPGASIASREHVPGPPTVGTDNGATTERALTTGSAVSDTVTGAIAYGDAFNPGDVPTVKTSFTSFTYQNAGHTDVTAALTAEQLAAIHAVEIPLAVVQDPTNLNIGVAHWTYNIADGAFDFLAAGEVLTLTYTAHVDNNFAPNNEFKEVTFTITITGTNDTPTIATSGNTITERVGSGNTATDTASGTVTFTDVDLTDRPIVSAALSASHPFQYLDAQGHDVTATLTPEQLAAITAVESTLTVVQAAGNANNGSATWTYSVVDKAFDFLAKGEILTLNYVAQVDDGHGGVVSTPITVSINGADVSVTGTNDVPTIVPESTTATGAMTEDAAATLTADGTITFQDLDLTDTHTAAFVLKSSDATANLPGYSEAAPLSQIGAFALTAISESPGNSTIGSVGWTFTLDDSDPVLQSLAKGQTITQIYTVTLTDNNGASVTQDVTVTITGTNDAPVITSDTAAATGAVTEDANAPNLTASGTLQIQDLDLIDTHAAGYVFSTSSSSAHLPGFDEGTTHIGTFSIDPAVTESTTDTDNHATLGWSFTLDDSDPVLQSLAQGQTITQVYTVTLTDNNGAPVTQDVTVTITGTNDAPTITVTNPDVVTEGNTGTPDPVTVTIAHQVAITDVDTIDVHTLYVAGTLAFDGADSTGPAPSGGPLSGLFTIDQSNGTVSYDKAAFDYLAGGEHVVATFTFDASSGPDTLHKTIAITINGENDAPTIAVTNPAAVIEGNTGTPDPVTVAVADHVTIADVDASDVHTLYVAGTLAFDAADSIGPAPSGGPLSGLFTVGQSNGTVSYDKAAFDYLASGEHVVATFTFDASSGLDALHKTIAITINGENDAPTITVTNPAAVAEGNTGTPDPVTLAVADHVTIADVDASDVHTLYVAGTLAFDAADSSGPAPSGGSLSGLFTIDQSSGTVSYDKAAFDYLAGGQNVVATFTFDASSGTDTLHKTITVTIDGINDAPVFSGDAAGTAYAANGAAVAIATNVAASDIDSAHYTGGTLTATVIAGGHEGDTLSIASNLISVSGNEIWFDADGAGPGVAVDIGTLTNNGINSLTVTLNSGADDAAVAALTQAIEFSNSKSAPVAGTRTVAFTLHDGGGTDNGGHDSAYFTADVTVAASNHAPVIETDQFVVTDNHDNGTTKVSGLYVTDADSSDTYTLSATTGAAPESSVTPSTAGPGATLADINTTLSHGIVYNPDTDHDADQPDTDSVTLTVADNFGATDTVHFIFNNDDEGPITLTGTSGKDLIFSTGNNDTLTGGAGADQFVFKPSGNANSDTITDFAPGQDHIDLRAFSGTVDSSNLSTWLASHAVVSPANSADVLITLDAHDSVTLKNVALGNLHVGDFIVSPHA